MKKDPIIDALWILLNFSEQSFDAAYMNGYVLLSNILFAKIKLWEFDSADVINIPFNFYLLSHKHGNDIKLLIIYLNYDNDNGIDDDNLNISLKNNYSYATVKVF